MGRVTSLGRFRLRCAFKHVLALETSLRFNQGTLNDTHQVIIDNLDVRYPAGMCPKHPKRQCFLHKKTKLHFDIANASGRKTVWAVAMVRTARLRSGLLCMLITLF
jgi:hypothetical protein